jgi:hypothetical protein
VLTTLPSFDKVVSKTPPRYDQTALVTPLSLDLSVSTTHH